MSVINYDQTLTGFIDVVVAGTEWGARADVLFTVTELLTGDDRRALYAVDAFYGVDPANGGKPFGDRIGVLKGEKAAHELAGLLAADTNRRVHEARKAFGRDGGRG